ncbi:MAG: enoyl-CoA hydratase/isomerase family protein [Planctomycetes bacterium]|nr:enoyl-CoA hydratase/isomerase family protein [Planctomycetota bacterium]
MTALVKVHVHEHVASIILNRPEKRNALSRALLQELHQALDDLHQERRVRAVVVTGAGTVFCAGMDLSEMLATSQEPDAHAQWYRDAETYQDLMLKMLRFPKPLVAAVNGPALAGGAGIMLACDIVVAARAASFGLPEPLRGIVAGVVSPMLHFRVGGGQSARLLLSAQTVDAEEAHRIGLFHELVDNTDLVWARASEVAGQCAQCAPEALQLTKRMLNETIGDHLTTMLAAGAAASATARTTEAAQEGLKAFLEKRKPEWK